MGGRRWTGSGKGAAVVECKCGKVSGGSDALVLVMMVVIVVVELRIVIWLEGPCRGVELEVEVVVMEELEVVMELMVMLEEVETL